MLAALLPFFLLITNIHTSQLPNHDINFLINQDNLYECLLSNMKNCTKIEKIINKFGLEDTTKAINYYNLLICLNFDINCQEVEKIGFEKWSDWSVCLGAYLDEENENGQNAQCSPLDGRQFRTRKCNFKNLLLTTNSFSKFKPCQGDTFESRPCKISCALQKQQLHLCQKWSKCSKNNLLTPYPAKCGPFSGASKRTCGTGSLSRYFYKPCDLEKDSKSCKVDGKFGEWSDWNDYGGVEIRKRSCEYPRPFGEGSELCKGHAVEVKFK